jgi:hypothetical protein
MVQRARNQLCERPEQADSWHQRWEALSNNLSTAAELSARGFDEQSIEAVGERAWDLRNIGAHSGEAVLISLGYPPEREFPVRRRLPIPGSELAPLHVREGIEAPFAAAHFAASELWKLMLECGFDEQTWEEQFRGDKIA